MTFEDELDGSGVLEQGSNKTDVKQLFCSHLR